MFLVYITKRIDKYKRVIPEKVIGGGERTLIQII
jgi:hypothetical protein